jgi:uncharacterized protein (TIGR02611 family)
MTIVMRRLRQILIFVLGFIVVGIGIILVPLPGPGLLVMLLGFMLLSTEFAWAKTHTERLKKPFREAFAKIKEASKAHDEPPK